MRMKHRWTGALLLVAALTLGACAPTNQGADDESASPMTEASDAPESAAPSPTENSMDDY
jgi:predicted small secreted protein